MWPLLSLSKVYLLSAVGPDHDSFLRQNWFSLTTVLYRIPSKYLFCKPLPRILAYEYILIYNKFVNYHDVFAILR